jgi:hypothetical protein
MTNQLIGVTIEQAATADRNTKWGTKKVHSLKINGEWFQCGFKDPRVKAGDVVNLQFTDDQYGHQIDMSTFVIASKGTGVVAVAAPPAGGNVQTYQPKPMGGKGVFPIPALDGQRSIVRQNALTNAREMITTLISTSKSNIEIGVWADRQMQFDNLSEEVIRIARKFEAYACGDLDMEEVQAEQQQVAKAA